MTAIETAAFAFLAGVTVHGVAGSVMELVSGERLSFAPPFTTRRHPVRLVAAPLLAGPMMLFNDALDARANGDISWLGLAGCAVSALVWTLAMGVAMLELFARA